MALCDEIDVRFPCKKCNLLKMQSFKNDLSFHDDEKQFTRKYNCEKCDTENICGIRFFENNLLAPFVEIDPPNIITYACTK